MKEKTQDETVNAPNDGIHFVVILLIMSIGWWLHLSEWLVSSVQVTYIILISLFVDKTGWRSFAQYLGFFLLLLLTQKIFLP